MYKIFADDTLIYDSTLDDYKIGKGSISLETNKSGSFTFSLYPDHFYYDRFIRLKTVITVYKFDKIVFRGRILNDVTDHWNNRVFTCEGELGFLQDSIIRPFDFSGTPEVLFTKLITEHNNQVDDFKRFKIGKITVVDPNDYIARSNSEYESTLSNINDRLIEGSLGGYVYITHGEDGTDPIPTINYLNKFTKVATQTVEFGVNLKEYTKTVNADGLATAIIPLGYSIDDGNSDTVDKRLTIASVNDGLDYIYSPEGVALYGWIYKTIIWDDVTQPSNLKAKAEKTMESLVVSNITLQLTAIDLRLIDPTVEPFNLNDYIRVVSKPHNFDSTLLCNKLTMDLLKPDNDTMTIGYTYTSFVGATNDNKKSINRSIQKVNANIQKNKEFITDEIMSEIQATSDSILSHVGNTYATSEELQETKTQIDLQKDSILLQIEGKYATSEALQETESKIDLQKDSILLSVSQEYIDKTNFETFKSSTESSITLLTDEIGLKVARSDFDSLGQTVDSAVAELELKIGKDDADQLISMINASADVITLNSNRLVINSTHFKLEADGSVTASNAHIQSGNGYYNVDISDGVITIDGQWSAHEENQSMLLLQFHSAFGELCGLFCNGYVDENMTFNPTNLYVSKI